MKNIVTKVFGAILGLLLAVVMLGTTACVLAGLLMLGWNVVVVAVLSIATPITFLTALVGVGIIYLILLLTTAVRAAVNAYTQKMQVAAALRAMEDLAKYPKAKEEDTPDILRHFR